MSGAEESKLESTRIVIKTSGPVAYRHLYQFNPPRITFRFFHNTVYSRMEPSVSVQKGIVKGIEADYFKEGSSGTKRALKSLTFTLIADTTYEVFDGPQSIILVIQHPKEIPANDLVSGKVTLTALSLAPSPSESRQAELSEALRLAMAKVLPAEPLPAAPPPIPTWHFEAKPKHQSPPVLYGVFFFSLLGGVIWSVIQKGALQKEKKRSWEMAKRIIALKEESVSNDAKAKLFEQEMMRFKGESQLLAKDKEILQEELERGTGDLHVLAGERVDLSDHLQEAQSKLKEKEIIQENFIKELREISERYDQEIACRRELEAQLEEARSHKKRSSTGRGEEKRHWTRVPILPVEKQDTPLTIEVQGPSGRLIYGYPKDVSLGGVSFELKESVELPETLALTLFFPKRKSGIEAQGKVIWKAQEGGNSRYGISFVDLSQNGSDLIGQFIQERLPLMRDAHRMIEESLKEKTRKTVTFALNAPAAKSVALVGDFNDWDPEMHLMKKTKDGNWKTVLVLPSGFYQYQFYVDGIWQVDPNAANRLPNPFGGENAVLEIT